MRLNMIYYTKKNGVLPETHFPKGSVVTYLSYDEAGKFKQKDIILLDHIAEKKHCDIFGTLALVIAEGEAPYIDAPKEGWSRVWHNGAKVRYASWVELAQLARAMSQVIEPGTMKDVDLSYDK